jgi:hypothetical protein
MIEAGSALGPALGVDASGGGMRWLEGLFTQLLLSAEEQGRSDVLSIRNPYPIEDTRADMDDLDDDILG